MEETSGIMYISGGISEDLARSESREEREKADCQVLGARFRVKLYLMRCVLTLFAGLTFVLLLSNL